MRIGALDHLAVELQHQPQYPVCRWVLGAKVHRIVTYLSHNSYPQLLEKTKTVGAKDAKVK
jgi:hypothetical protein